jgi:ankyrin repeat protein
MHCRRFNILVLILSFLYALFGGWSAFADGDGMSGNPTAILTNTETKLTAVFSDEQKSVTALEKGEPNLDYTDEEVNTLLHLSVMCGNREIFTCLCKSGVDINAQNNWGTTPLHLAVQYHENRMAQDLIGLGADLELKDSKHQTPLILAYKNKIWDLLAALLRAGADIRNGYYSEHRLISLHLLLTWYEP